MPTLQDIKALYHDIEEEANRSNEYYEIIIENFNAKEGRLEGGKELVGIFGLEERNQKKPNHGRVYDDVMYIVNTFYRHRLKTSIQGEVQIGAQKMRSTVLWVIKKTFSKMWKYLENSTQEVTIK